MAQIFQSIQVISAKRKDMADFDYESLLERAREKIPTDISSKRRWRLHLHKFLSKVITPSSENFKEVIDMMERDEDHFSNTF